MGIGKYFLYAFGGFMAMGAVAMPFIPDMSPEQDLASGKSFFASQCSDLTRNRKINGSFGRGHKYCTCVMGELENILKTGDEFRYANAMHDASGAERWVFEKTRMKGDIDRARKKFSPIIGEDRVYSIDQDFYPITIGCARSM